jgi:hypothetical protein
MTIKDISAFRLQSQQVAGTKFKTAKELVSWMGATQAQDFPMARWAVGIRLPGSTEETITSAINNGEVIRTHLLRPTWHLAAPEDIYWMLELTAPQIIAFAKSRDNQLGLTKEVLSKSNSIIEKALQKEKFLPREELVKKFEAAGLPDEDNRASHLLMRAELDGIICSGEAKGNKQTYTLLAERVKKKKVYKRDEALAQLAQRYFTSHAPAAMNDFTWWSGLSVRESKLAFNLVKSGFISQRIGEQTYLFTDSFTTSGRKRGSAYLIPAYDEFLISYKDRSASLSCVDNSKAISTNGIFKPVVVVNGQVKGIWKRSIKKDKVIVETELFNSPDKLIKRLIEKAVITYGHFLKKETEIVFK